MTNLLKSEILTIYIIGSIDINPLQTNEISKIMWLKLDRNFINSLASGITFAVKDFGKIGSLDTDMVAKLYMSDSTNLRVKSLGYGWLMSEDELKKMIKTRKNLLSDFAAFTSYYYRGFHQCSFSIVMPMDMSHAHYWGNFGFPVYFPLGTDKYYYINDYLLAISLIDNVIYHFARLKGNSKEMMNRIRERTPELKKEIQKKTDQVKKQIGDTFKNLQEEINRKKDDINNSLKKIKDIDIKKKVIELLNKLKELERKNNELKDQLAEELENEVKDFCTKELDNYMQYKNKEHREGFFYLDNYLDHRINEINQKIKDELIQQVYQFQTAIIEKLEGFLQSIKKAEKGITASIKTLVNKTKQQAQDIIKNFKEKLPGIRDKILETIDSVKRAFMVYIKGGGKLIPYDIDLAVSQEYFHLKSPVTIDYKSKPETIDTSLTTREYSDKYLKKKYNHFLEIAPGNERSDFEDYFMQTNHTIASTLRYAFDLLPFYHTDPRRFYKGEKYIDTLIKHTRETHGFFLTQRQEVHKLSLTPIEFTDNYLKNDLFSPRNKTSWEEVFNKILPNGLFWGLKLYTELGYPPNLFDTRDPDIKKSFKYQFEGQCKHMEDIFKKCIDLDIPITCHAGPKGMTIADTYIYLREYEKENNTRNKHYEDALFDITPERLIDSIEHVDRSYVSPEAWAKVLGRHEFKNLRLCLAHFGGFDSWIKNTGEFDWRERMSKLISEHENLYTDISCFLNIRESLPNQLIQSQVDKITDSHDRRQLEMGYVKSTDLFDWGFITIHDWDLVYTKHLYKLKSDLEPFQRSRLRNILRNAGIIQDDIGTLAGEMARFLNGPYGDALKEKILMGSDWPMFERDFRGAGEYYSRMFELLKLVTKKLNTYDVWHQFAVINPLKFLGLLKDDYKVDMDKFNKHKDAILKELDVPINILVKQFHITKREKNSIINVKIPKKMKELNYLSKTAIRKAEDMKKDGEFIILKDWE